MLREFVRRRPFLSYYLLAALIGSLVVVVRYQYAVAYEARTGAPFDYNKVLLDWLAEFNHGRFYPNVISIGWVAAMRDPIYFGVFVFAGAPTISAIVVSWIGWGGEGLKRLFGRLKLWPSRAFRKDALTAYAILAIIFFGFSVLHLVLIKKFQGPAEMLHAMRPFGLPASLFPLAFLIGGFIDEGATCEELGWRGFALPTLLDRMRSPTVVAILLGTLWWAWHFPREIPALIAKGFPANFVADQAGFLLLVVAITFTMTYFFHRTGSLIPAILLHGWGNFLTKCVSLGKNYFDDRTWMFVAGAVILLLLTGTSLGRKRYLALRAEKPPTQPARSTAAV